jgi:hypothetical protein
MTDINAQRLRQFCKGVQVFRLGVLLAGMFVLTGCSHSPTFNLLGSYFPAWMICMLLAGVITYLTHFLLMRTKFIHELWPLQIIYTPLFVLWTCLLWIVFFSS